MNNNKSFYFINIKLSLFWNKDFFFFTINSIFIANEISIFVKFIYIFNNFIIVYKKLYK